MDPRQLVRDDISLFDPMTLHGDMQSFQVTLTLSVADVRALWTAAAGKAIACPGMTMSDVVETIGPIEDPCIESCVSMLTSPAAIPGCAIDAFEIQETPAQRRAA